LAELQAELQELESQIILTQGQGAPSSPPVALNNGQGESLLPYCKKRLRIITRIKKQTDFSPPE
jgi:hypothetical protein